MFRMNSLLKVRSKQKLQVPDAHSLLSAINGQMIPVMAKVDLGVTVCHSGDL